jgi:hypothetical protein
MPALAWLQMAVHDEGSCWVPAVLRPAIILTHWVGAAGAGALRFVLQLACTFLDSTTGGVVCSL